MTRLSSIWRTARRLWLAVATLLWLVAAVPLFEVVRGFASLVLADDPAARAAALITDARAPDFEREIRAALGDDDAALAGELVVLADRESIPLAPMLLLDVRASNALNLAKGAENIARGVVFGEMRSPAGTAAAIASDLTSIGDVRDLIREGARYPNHDPLIVALAGTGLALTAGTIVTGGTTLPVTGPAKVGAGILKAARRAGTMTARFSGDINRLARRAVDTDALQATVRSASRLDMPATRRSATAVVRRAEADELATIATAVGDIASGQGPRAALASLKVAETSTELNRLRRVATRYDGTFRAALRIAPDAAKAFPRIAKLMWRLGEILFWIVGWALGAALLTLKLVRLTVRGASVARRLLVPRALTGRLSAR